jgi:hypothetical protein
MPKLKLRSSRIYEITGRRCWYLPHPKGILAKLIGFCEELCEDLRLRLRLRCSADGVITVEVKVDDGNGGVNNITPG